MHGNVSTGFGVKYRFAADLEGKTVDIESMDVVRSKDYACLSCLKVLRPVLGEIRQKHFRHKYDKDGISCSFETYLHNLAKITFYETYQRCLQESTPYWFRYPVTRQCTYCELGPCKVVSGSAQSDLTLYFPEIRLEQRDGEFIPDLLLEGERRLYIEIAVTHRVDDKKKASGVRILEITVHEEGDIDVIRSGELCLGGRVRGYNLRAAPVTGDFKDLCEKGVNVFHLNGDGEAWLTETAAMTYAVLATQGEYIERVGDLLLGTFHTCLTKAFRKKKPIRHCWLCVHHTVHYKTHKSYCNKRMKGTGGDWPSNAIGCEAYQMGPDEFVENALRHVLKSREVIRSDSELPPHPIDRAGTCAFCGVVTTDWWVYDSLSETCKCNKCMKEGKC